jgi:hypothetical protein
LTVFDVDEVDAQRRGQLHRSRPAGDANAPDRFIANLTDSPDAAGWLKVTAERDGSFSVTNGTTEDPEETKAYR